MVRLTVRRHDGPHVEICYHNGFIVDLPGWVRQRDHDTIVATELKFWLKQRVRRDVSEIAGPYCKRFALKPRAIRTADMKTGWGSCGPRGSILINWALVLAPKAVLEYVVAHELAHVTVRTHGPEFWAHLAMMMPNYERPRGWLDIHQASLDVSFLDTSN
jgi:predicted metal-dependent hydrolase